MNKKTLDEEKTYLETVLCEIDRTKNHHNKILKKNQDGIRHFKKFFVDNFYDSETDDLAEINLQIEHLENQSLHMQREIARLDRQRKNPYFGRFDFKANDDEKPKQYYIGLGLVQNEKNENLTYDWRADICSLYYDDVMGKTSYFCPDGKIEGEVSLKRQYKIQDNKLAYYIDSNLVIDDDILMEQLSQNASSKMHDIVSTIQKEQNLLIRADDFANTIVQGVAGSGKTSVAMHRVSFLLYKYRKSLKSEDILILSPSELFSDYLSEILPSLGEEKSFTTTFASMAKRLLGESFQTREELLEKVVEKQSQNELQNIAIKSSFEFLEDLKKFLKDDICNLFMPKTLVFGDVCLSKEFLSDLYFVKLKNLPIYKRIEVLADIISDQFKIPMSKRHDLFKQAKKILYNKFLTTDILKIYNLFLSSVDLDEVQSIGAYDIAPVLLIKENLFGLKNTYDAKYVIVDEMQDYTPCHFFLFDKIWHCGKLYLGDIYQSLDRTLSPSYLKDLAMLTHSKIKYLNKSYRSTKQISLFAQKILGKHIANNVNRNGSEVECIRTKNIVNQIEQIVESLNGTQSIAIICKKKSEIKALQKQSSLLKKFKLLDSNKINSKKVFATPVQAKGVEFDCVIVPFANDENYHNQLDCNLLYITATRALHKLFFVSDKMPSRFLLKNKN